MQVLLIESSKLIADSLEIALNNYGHITNRKSFESFVNSGCYVKDTDVLILNIEYEIGGSHLKKIKDCKSNICIVGLNTSKNWTKKLFFLKNGFDDILDYPFPTQEIVIRIENLAKRPRNTQNIVLSTKYLRVDTQAKRVHNKRTELKLRKKEFCLLEYLVKNKNRTVSRSELLDHVWDYKKINNSNTVDVHIKRLRDKIEEPEAIQTVHGFGYRVSE